MISLGAVLAHLFIVSSGILAQQFPAGSFPLSYPGLSSSCLNALNQTVSCPPYLGTSALTGPLNSTQLTGLCNATCYSSLQTVRSGIKGNCTLSTDIIVNSNISYPATYIVDNFIYAWNVSCRKDKSTGAYCDTLFATWANQSQSNTTAQICSDCALGIAQIELDSPFGYGAGFAQQFQLTTSSCQATGYPFTSPAAYALNGSATSTIASATSSTASSSCTGSYTVQAGDTCNSVALAKDVSTFALLYYNNLNIYCANFPSAGTVLCLPETCTVYTVQRNDSCISIALDQSNITATQIQAWNPNINALCGNMDRINGTQICISPPGGWLDVATSTNLSVSTAISAVPAPTNAELGTNANCGQWYTIQSGDTCALVSTYQSISLNDFYFLNPEINSTCGNLILGQAYCVQAVGSISTYANYTYGGVTANVCNGPSAPASCFGATSSLPSASLLTGNTSFTPTGTASSTASVTIAPATMLPTASGTISGCYLYRNYMASNITGGNSTMTINSCTYLAILYGVNVTALAAWNPSLSSNSSVCSLQPGYSYCVQKTAPTSNTTSVPIGGICEPINGTVAGTVANCNCYMNVFPYDNGSYACADIESDYNITLAQIELWNPWVGSNCTAGLYANLTADTERAVCIGTGANTATSTSTSTSAAPTQSGIISSCTKYYTVQSGDSCGGIESANNITFAQFYAWNPAVGSNCQSLLIGYAYCVAAPTTSTTTTGKSSGTTSSSKPTTTPSTSTMAPTQSGIAANCNKYYTVQSGDSCSSVETAYSITFAQLYAWNPAIGSNCQYLVIGDAVCVGVSGTSTVSSSTASSTTTKSTASSTTTTSTKPTTTSTTSTSTKPTTTSTTSTTSTSTKPTTTSTTPTSTKPTTSTTPTSTKPTTSTTPTSTKPTTSTTSIKPTTTSTTSTSTKPTTTTTSTKATTTTSHVTPPAPTQSGVAANCNAYYTVKSGDSCSSVETAYSITFAQLYSWNPAIGSNCQYLVVGDAVCVGVSS